jgi:probable HAF family extracellular repeat protein
MRIPVALALLSCTTAAHAAGQFVVLPTHDAHAHAVSYNGQYVSASRYGSMGIRWSTAEGSETLIPSVQDALGINNVGTIAGTVFVYGGAYQGGQHLAAFAATGAEPVLLDRTLAAHSIAFDVSDDGTVVGASFDSPLHEADIAFMWTAADGMSALSVPRPQHPSRATAISADGSVIVGWNGDDEGRPRGIVWLDGVPMDITNGEGAPVGEAWAVTDEGHYVVGSSYADSDSDAGAWRWDAANGVVMIPGMAFARGASADGHVVIGGTDPFALPSLVQSLVWREDAGSVLLADYLAELEIEVPAIWQFGHGLSGVSADGSVLTGSGHGQSGLQSYVVRIFGNLVFADGFESATP